MKSLYSSEQAVNENFDALNRYMRSDQWCLTVLHPTDVNRTACKPKADSFPGECVYEGLQYRIILRRYPDYQLINLLLPAFLIVIISSCVFIVPPGSGDKMGLSVSILLSLYMFTQLMYDMMPDTGSFVPLLSQYFLVSIGLVSTSCVYSSISAVFASALPAPPRCLRKLVVYLGPILICDMIRSRQKRSKSKRRDKKEQQKDLPINEVSQQKRHSIGAIEPLWAATPQSQDKEAGNGQDPSKTVSDVNEDYEDKEHEFVGFSLDQSDKLTWAAVGALFDRLFFILHVLSTLTVATMYLVQGFTPWKEYGGLNLTSRDFQYICAQSDLQNDPHSKSFCPKNKTEFKLV